MPRRSRRIGAWRSRCCRCRELGPDGHPTRGGFLPPVPLPRRMWAGGEINLSMPFASATKSKRTSRISDITLKTGSTGTLCFVSVDHVVTSPRGIAIRERQDIVYREMPAVEPAAPAKPPRTPPAAQHRETHMADPVLLFRYSALTFNGHRIHYDRDYVTKVEGYPGLIFHGPLQAAFIVELAAKLHGGQPPKKFVYRGLQPLFEGSEFSVNANDDRRRHGTVDRECRGPADHEGDGDVVSFVTPSFRGDAKHRTRNLEIPGLVLTHHPGMTAAGFGAIR